MPDVLLETILVVDDDPYVLKQISKLVAPKGYTLLTANDGEEAIDVYNRHKPEIHLLLTDVVMPGISGFQLADHLTQWDRRLGVVYMSEHNMEPAFAKTGQRFLKKPFNELSLLAKLREALSEAPAFAAPAMV